MTVVRRSSGSQAGFTLVTVVWALGLLALVMSAFLLVARSHVRQAASMRDAAELQALAEAGIRLGILDIVAGWRLPAGTRRFPPDGRAVACRMASGTLVVVQVEDEAGKVDVNVAGVPLLLALFVGLGHDPASASALAEAIADYRDPDDLRRLNGAERAEYERAGRPRGPANGPFEAVEELAQVLGIGTDLAERLADLTTVYSGSAGIDPAVAPPALLRSLAPGAGGEGRDAGTTPAGAPFPPSGAGVPRPFVVPTRAAAFRIRATAVSPTNAMATSEAVVTAAPRGDLPYAVKRWQRRLAADPGDVPAAAGPC